MLIWAVLTFKPWEGQNMTALQHAMPGVASCMQVLGNDHKHCSYQSCTITAEWGKAVYSAARANRLAKTSPGRLAGTARPLGGSAVQHSCRLTPPTLLPSYLFDSSR